MHPFILVIIYIISFELMFVTTQLISLIRKGTVFEVKKENLLQAYCSSNLLTSNARDGLIQFVEHRWY